MDAAKITRQSKSNLALAFVSLGRERRRDITTFYAFCRLIDDIADSPELSVREKAAGLAGWRGWLHAPGEGEPQLAAELRALLAKYRLAPAMLEEIMAGVEMDLAVSRYATFEDLRVYCYRVASAVGLVSIEIFGYRNPACRDYAVELGLALQSTNIIRDVGKDLRSNRVYLPQDELARFGYSEADLFARTYDERFVTLMEFQAQRARAFFAKAAALLPVEDRRSMIAAEIMGAVYSTLLRRMEQDRFRVFEREYRLNPLQKTGHVMRQLLRF
ncbi:MAG: phytoene/squalene synthase family protein [Chthoniobacterales bacterium]